MAIFPSLKFKQTPARYLLRLIGLGIYNGSEILIYLIQLPLFAPLPPKNKKYAYLWADGICCNMRMEET